MTGEKPYGVYDGGVVGASSLLPHLHMKFLVITLCVPFVFYLIDCLFFYCFLIRNMVLGHIGLLMGPICFNDFDGNLFLMSSHM